MYVKKMIQDFPSLVAEDISVSIKNEQALALFSDNAESFSLVFPRRSTVLGRTAIPFHFLDKKGDVMHKMKVITEVDAKSTFYRTTRRIRRGEVLTTHDVEAVSLSIQGRTHKRIRHLSDLVGQMAKSSIVSEKVLFSYMLDDVPDVRKGTPVRVIIQKNDFELKIKGHVLDDGTIGDIVRVRTKLESNRVLQGEVVDEQTVRYNFVD